MIIDFTKLFAVAKATMPPRVEHIYLHWTGGWHEPNNTDLKDYHLLIKGDGSLVLACENFGQTLDHTFGRNSNSIAISLCCGVLGVCGPEGLMINSQAPYTGRQIENMAKSIAVISQASGLTIDIEHVLTHAEAADNLDGWMIDYSGFSGGANGQPLGMYGPCHTCERWDLYKLTDYDGAIRNGGDVIRGKANWYREQGGI
jgi:hypothetical protein